MAHKSLTEQRRREVEELATTRRAHGHPFEDIAAEIIGIAGITRLWAWRLAKGWRRSELLERLRRLGDPSVDESMLWRWEIGERDPSKEHLDRLCQVYHTRPDLVGYGRDYSQPSARQDGAATNGQPSTTLALTVSMVTGALASEPLAMVEALTASTVSSESLTVLERAAVWHQPACQEQATPLLALALELARQYHAVRLALAGRQRVGERRRLAAVAARLGSQLGVLLWPLDQQVASSYFDAAAVAAEEADDPALGAWVAERRVSRAGTASDGLSE